jgi:hypothetical protein
VAQLKASNPDLLINVLSYGYAPLWQAMQTAGWSPNILSHPSAWYDGFTGMGSLVNKAVSFYNACADSPSQTWPADVAAQVRLGDANPQSTLRVYAQATERADGAAAERSASVVGQTGPVGATGVVVSGASITSPPGTGESGPVRLSTRVHPGLRA